MKPIPMTIKPFRHVSKTFEVSCYTGSYIIETSRCFDNEFSAFHYVVNHFGGLLFFKVLELLYLSKVDHLDLYSKDGDKLSIYPQS